MPEENQQYSALTSIEQMDPGVHGPGCAWTRVCMDPGVHVSNVAHPNTHQHNNTNTFKRGILKHAGTGANHRTVYTVRPRLSGPLLSGSLAYPEENRGLPIYSICHAYIQYACSVIWFPRPSGYFCGKRMCAVKRGLTVLRSI